MQTRDDLLLERFFDRTLTSDEKNELEDKLASNSELAETFRWQSQLTKIFKHNEAQAMKATLQAEEQRMQPQMRVSWLRPQYLMAAAAMMVVALAAVWFFNQPPAFSETELVFEPYVNTFTERGRGEPSSSDTEGIFRVKMHEALIPYDTSNYIQAEKNLLQVLAATDEHKLAINFYRGVCFYAQDKFAEASAILKPVAEKKGGYQAPAMWYLALANLKLDNRTEAKEILNQYIQHPDSIPKRKEASAILKKLE